MLVFRVVSSTVIPHSMICFYLRRHVVYQEVATGTPGIRDLNPDRVDNRCPTHKSNLEKRGTAANFALLAVVAIDSWWPSTAPI
jgi:hypothetical protein